MRYDHDDYGAAEAMPMQESPLMLELMRLRESLDKLQMLLRELQDRLGPALLPDPPSEMSVRNEQDGMKRDRTTALHSSVLEAQQQVNRLTEVVSRLTQRVEV